jgi:UDP-N-acetylglucosamine 2-epimerase (non-hydrolysing)
MPVICSLHPRTKSKMIKFGISEDGDAIKFITPLGFFDFVKLEKNAYLVLTDSGTVQEECCIFKIPNITIRDVTERPETIEAGSNIITGAEPELILSASKLVTSININWTPPKEYMSINSSDIVLKILFGYKHFTRI